TAFYLMTPRPPRSTLFPYTTLFRSEMDLADATVKTVASANTGGDTTTSNHMRNFMECVRSRKQTNAPVEAGYQHSIACIMTTAASRTGEKVTFDEKTQEVMAGSKVFKY